MEKKKTIKVKEQEFAVNFGVMWFYKHFKEAIGVDLIQKGNLTWEEIQGTQVVDYIAAFLYAGVKADYSVRREESPLSFPQAEALVSDLSEGEAGALLTECMLIMAGATEEEEEKNEEPQAAKA